MNGPLIVKYNNRKVSFSVLKCSIGKHIIDQGPFPISQPKI